MYLLTSTNCDGFAGRRMTASRVRRVNEMRLFCVEKRQFSLGGFDESEVTHETSSWNYVYDDKMKSPIITYGMLTGRT
jgi:hypothetical protein